jgi:hypothetical protein
VSEFMEVDVKIGVRCRAERMSEYASDTAWGVNIVWVSVGRDIPSLTTGWDRRRFRKSSLISSD